MTNCLVTHVPSRHSQLVPKEAKYSLEIPITVHLQTALSWEVHWQASSQDYQVHLVCTSPPSNPKTEAWLPWSVSKLLSFTGDSWLSFLHCSWPNWKREPELNRPAILIHWSKCISCLPDPWGLLVMFRASQQQSVGFGRKNSCQPWLPPSSPSPSASMTHLAFTTGCGYRVMSHLLLSWWSPGLRIQGWMDTCRC